MDLLTRKHVSGATLIEKLDKLNDADLLQPAGNGCSYFDFQSELQGTSSRALRRVDYRLAQSVARLAAEHGRIFVLEWLRREGVWDPTQSGMVLTSAEEAGKLALLLTAFHLPLAQYPYFAQSHLNEAVAIFKGDVQSIVEAKATQVPRGLSDLDQTSVSPTPASPTMKTQGSAAPAPPHRFTGLPRLPGEGRPSPEANLLANFLLVPGPAAEKVLTEIVEEMVVFQALEDAVDSYETTKEFPAGLGAVYVRRVLDGSSAWRSEYDRHQRKLRMTGYSQEFRTSAEYRVTLTDLSRRASLVPPQAALFCYVYQGEGFPTGGFLYCDRHGKPLAVNSISFKQERDAFYAFCFGDYVLLRPDAVQELRGQAHPVDEPALMKGGAVMYAWVGPGEVLPSGFAAGVVGGFAYFFPDPTMDRYFPIVGAGKVSDSKVILRSREESLKSLPVEMMFPETLGAIYLQREVTIQEGYTSIIKYKGEAGEEGVLTSPTPAWELRTSPLYPVTLTEAQRRAALIPLQATHFAYVYYGENFPTGGFLYVGHDKKLDDIKKPLAVNSISFSHRRYALSLGAYQLVGPATCEKLHLRAQDISVRVLLDKGADRYAWVGPGEALPGGFVASAGGGFVYMFADDPEKNRYFPIVGASEVIDRGILFGEISCAMLRDDANGTEIERYVTHTKKKKRPRWMKMLQLWNTPSGRNQGCGEPVRVARVRVPGVLHPQVLHGLAYTPHAGALDTPAAKAIAQAAYERARTAILVDMCLEICSLIAIYRITNVVRSDGSGDSADSDAITNSTAARLLSGTTTGDSWSMSLSIAAIILVWLKDVLKEVSLMWGYSRRSWLGDYFTWHKAMGMPYLALMLTVIILCLVGHGRGDNFGSNSPLRPLLAAVGCMMWVRVLFACRGFQAFRLGSRILPILAALGEIKDFLFIMLFLMGAHVQACYALSTSDTLVSDILFLSYRLAFMSSFDTSNDILFLSDTQTNHYPWDEYQYMSFIIFSFLLSVAMMNIFIGVMASAFDHATEQVSQLFVRARACIGLDFALHKEGLNLIFCPACCRRAKGDDTGESDMLWFCYRRSDEASEDPDSEATVRGALRVATDSLNKRLEEMAESIKQLQGGAFGATGPMGLPQKVDDQAPALMMWEQNVHEEVTKNLEVTIECAKNLRDADAWSMQGSSDSYCTCQVDGKPETKILTPTISDSTNPTWAFVCTMTSVTEGSTLRFEVWDQDNMKADDLLGSATLSCKKLFQAVKYSGKLPLFVEEEHTGATLCVLIKVKDPDAAEPLSKETDGVVSVSQLVVGTLSPLAAEFHDMQLPGMCPGDAEPLPAAVATSPAGV